MGRSSNFCMVVLWRKSECVALQSNHCIVVNNKIYYGSPCKMGAISRICYEKLGKIFTEMQPIKEKYITHTRRDVLDQVYKKPKSVWPYSQKYYDFVLGIQRANESEEGCHEFLRDFNTKVPFQCIACVMHSMFEQLQREEMEERLRKMNFGEEDVCKLSSVLKRSHGAQFGGARHLL